MEFLLDSVPRISRPGQDENPLSWAAKGGHVGAISFLIRLGADPKNSRRRPFSGNMYATYPLEAAAEGGSVEVLEFLFDIVERWDWWEWRNALVAAAQHGHTEAVRCLLSHAAHDEAWDSEDEGEEDEDEESEGWPDEDGYNSDVSGFTEIRAERRQERRERERKHADSRLQVQVQDALVAACSRGHIQVNMDGD
jgi:ankyrin repeat protein